MENSPFFSVVIPVYNAEATIKKSILSVLNQTESDYELILINDGSKDDSRNVIEMLIDRSANKTIRLINQENCGAGRTRNNGITYARGKYIAFLDSDDYWDEEFLYETKRVIEDTNADLVYIDIVREREDGTVIRYERMSTYSDLDKDLFIRRQLTGAIPWGGVRKIVRRSLLMGHNIRYATNIKVGEESLYSYKALYYSSAFAFQSKALYHYVDNEMSLTSHDTVSNSINVYDFIRASLNDGEIDKKYESTDNALGLTTMAITTNVLAQQYGVIKSCHEAKKLYAQYTNDYSGKIDRDSLEKRVKICAPWIRLGSPLPVVIAGKLQQLLRGK